VPSVRQREVVEHFAGPQNVSSICGPDFTSILEPILAPLGG
jgi:hypothetical protein